MIAEIHRAFASGKLEEHAQELDLDLLMEEDPDTAAALLAVLDTTPRPLQ